MTRKLTDEEKKLWQDAMKSIERGAWRLAKEEPPKKTYSSSPTPISAKLDLHGLTLEKAHKQFLAFIMEAAILGHAKVLVITGKGKNGESLIKKELPHWASNIGFAKLDVSMAENRHGGAGAAYIKIRQVNVNQFA